MKDGKLVRNENRLDVSARIRQRASKHMRVVKRGYSPQTDICGSVSPDAYRCPETLDLFAEKAAK